MTLFVRDASSASQLTSELKSLVTKLEPGVRDRLDSSPEVLAKWRSAYDALHKGERTSETWVQWSDSRITQVASAWVMLTVFARFCEDNELFGPSGPVWFAGPQHRRQEAVELRIEMFRRDGEATDVTWLRRMMAFFADQDATRSLVGDDCPASGLDLSDAGAEQLVLFWREHTDDGDLRWDFTDPDLSTRFLGDVYQDLSEAVRKKFALLQTPEFVEEFILDLTLTPALEEQPLQGFKLIDPTCGSGHFLIGGFHRILAAWQDTEPDTPRATLVQRTLDSVTGVDINPYAVAIARFRMLIAAMQASRVQNLKELPRFDFRLACGDSLTKVGHGMLDFGAGNDGDTDPRLAVLSETERRLLIDVLTPGQYDVVVGNPPYVTPKDKAARKQYGRDYSTCHMKYALSVPFMQRFFQLAKPDSAGKAGFVGQITSNSFMKREFGKKLIGDFLTRKDLTYVVDTSGAYIPGHGTPTVIVAGRNQLPTLPHVRAVLGVQGEPGRPDDAAQGLVWSSIRDHTQDSTPDGTDEIYEDQWITVTDLPRKQLAQHPWSLTGGGAVELAGLIDMNSKRRLKSAIAGRIGFASFPGLDEAFISTRAELSRSVGNKRLTRELIEGEVVRDWETSPTAAAFVPYAPLDLVPFSPHALWSARQWPYRTSLSATVGFSGESKTDAGVAWWAWYRWVPTRYRTPLSITFAFVATHNHFVLDRGGKVFKQSAPVIKLPKAATEDDHLKLLGVLNSSVACFWLKQNCHDKGNGGIGGGIASDTWERFYEFTGTTLKDFPLPASLPLERGRVIDSLAQELTRVTPAAVAESAAPTAQRLEQARAEYERLRGLLIAQQEELDWECYHLYGITEKPLTYSGTVPQVALGERAFEISMARDIDRGELDTAWFDRHGSVPTSVIPAHLPADYQELIQRRLDAAAASKNVRLLEAPEHKRRWASDGWEAMQQAALQDWLLTQLEAREFWYDAQGRPRTRTVNELTTALSGNEEFEEVLQLWGQRPNEAMAKTLERLLVPEAVPHAAPLRLKESGMRKRRAWEHTWDLQRQEDAGTLPTEPDPKQPGGRKNIDIPVPPKYSTADFRKASWWQHRGKLDVPKERFILYPGAGSTEDTSMLLGWAGWDHADQGTALASLIIARSGDGSDSTVVVPLLVGLSEVLPWIHQWHPDVMPEMGLTLGEYLTSVLEQNAQDHGLAVSQLADWRPPTTQRKKSTTKRKKKATS